MWETGVISRILRKVAMNPHIDKGCDYSHPEDEELRMPVKYVVARMHMEGSCNDSINRGGM